MVVNDVQRVLIKNQIQAEVFKRSFYHFVQWAAVLLEPNTKWKWNWHHEYICNILQEETLRIKEGRPRNKHLIINVPFRSSKSLIVSILYPIWSWMVNPNMSFINLSYSANLSTDHSNKVQAVINHPKFKELFPWEFDDNQYAKTDFKLKQGGARLSGGMTGTVLGRGSDVIIMDDPNNTKRLSEIERHNTITSWKDTVNTRLNDPEVGLFIVIQQRLHAQDLSGYLIDAEGDNWYVICLPAELGRNVNPPELAEHYDEDGLLWGDRFTRRVLNNFKVTLGSVGYSNQLLQLTTAPEGNIIKREWIPKILWEEFETICKVNNVVPKWDIFLDSAQTEKKKNDPSGILIACKVLNLVYVRKVIEKRLTMPDLLEQLKSTAKLFNIKTIYVEPKSNGKDIVAMIKRNTVLNITELPSPTDDKTTRLNAVSPLIESKRFVLIEDISNDTIIDQLCEFPNASHDEFVDLTGYALTKYIKNNSINYLML